MMRSDFAAFLTIVVGIACVGPQPPDPKGSHLVGLADFHTHQFGYLGFGGKLLSHSVHPTDGCMDILEIREMPVTLGDMVRSGFLKEATEQGQGKCYPTTSNLASQRMDTESLRRAVDYGLRLIVMFAVNNEFLCKVTELVPDCPTDRQAIESQIKVAKQLEARIDKESDGKGWYRIVTTPTAARRVISQGQLAVVLGVEAVNAFGCEFRIRGSVPGVPEPIPWSIFYGPPANRPPPTEPTYALDCEHPDRPGEVQTQRALAHFEHYWKLGVRHFYPIHNMDGVAGGTALSVPLLHAESNPSRLVGGELLNKVPDIDRVIRAVRPPLSAWNCSPRFEFDGGRCNALGLSEPGRALIRLMASYGAVIDIDHISWKGKRELLDDDGLFGGVYPFVSSHAGIDSLSRLEKDSEGQTAPEDFSAMIRAGGAFAPILPPATDIAHELTFPGDATAIRHDCGGTSESFVQAYRYIVDKLKGGRLLNGNRAFVGVGFGSDFSAPVPIAAAGRFATLDFVTSADPNPWTIGVGHRQRAYGGGCYIVTREDLSTAGKRFVTYPFSSPLDEDSKFDRTLLPWSGRHTRYDISFDGVAHVGMIPDFVEELRVLGLTQEELQPLWHGAEAYVRAWEASMSWEDNFSTEDDDGIRAECSALRSDFMTEDKDGRWASTLDQLEQKGCHPYRKP